MAKKTKPQLRTNWNRAPLALAVAIATGGPVAQVRADAPPVPLVPAVERADLSESQATAAELVIVDSGVEDIAVLIKAVPIGAQWFVLDGSRDGVVQLAEIASRFEGIKAVHLVSHGEDGELRLGGSVLAEGNLLQYREQLQVLKSAMISGADLLIYGCKVAESAKGKRFVSSLSAVTGLDVAASDDVTRDDDWELEIVTGEINVVGLKPEGFSGSLDIMSGDGSGGGGGGGIYGADGGAGGGDNDILTGTAGSDVIFGDGSGGGAGASSFSYYTYYSGPGGGGADTLNGGAGDDILFGDGFDGFPSSTGPNGQYGTDGGFGGGGGGGGSGYYSYAYGTGQPGSYGLGGLLAGYGGDAYQNGGNGVGSTGGVSGMGGAYSYVYFYGGGGGGWSDNSGAGDGGQGSQHGVRGADGSTTQLSHADDGLAGSIWEFVKTMVDAGSLDGRPSGAGGDTLNGGPGSDDLFGMGGADTFQFEANDSPTANGDSDTIHDFVPGTDIIELLACGNLIDTAARDAILLAQTAAPTASDRTIQFSSGNNSMTIVVKGIATDLTAADVPAIASGTGGCSTGGGSGGGGGAASPWALLVGFGLWLTGMHRRRA